MSWFRWRPEDRHRAGEDRLREAERNEEEAMRRLVDAGIQATISATEGRQAAEQLSERFDKTKEDAERVIFTAEGALRLLERGRRR